jgi:hypothetical protein
MRHEESLGINQFQRVKQWRSSLIRASWYNFVKVWDLKRQGAYKMPSPWWQNLPEKEHPRRQRDEIVYRWLLKKVQNAVGPQMVVLCAAGQGQSAEGGMRYRVQMESLAEIKEQEEELKCAVLQTLADEDSASIRLVPVFTNIQDLICRSWAGYTGWYYEHMAIRNNRETSVR